jgi:hypothetical protein
MGWYLRKAFPLGKFLRLNLSRRGVGASLGIPGLRIGVDASGRPYVSGGRHGVYFRKRLPTGTQGPPEAPTEGVAGEQKPGIPWLAVWLVAVFGVTALVVWIWGRWR